MLMGEEDAPFMFGCLAKALKDATLTRQAVSSALASASLKPFLEHLSGQQLAWLQRHMQLTADSATSEVTNDLHDCHSFHMHQSILSMAIHC